MNLGSLDLYCQFFWEGGVDSGFIFMFVCLLLFDSKQQQQQITLIIIEILWNMNNNNNLRTMFMWYKHINPNIITMIMLLLMMKLIKTFNHLVAKIFFLVCNNHFIIIWRLINPFFFSPIYWMMTNIIDVNDVFDVWFVYPIRYKVFFLSTSSSLLWLEKN